MTNEKQFPMLCQEWALDDPSTCGPNPFGLTASDFEMDSPEPEGDLDDLMREMKEAPPWSDTFNLDVDLPFTSSGLQGQATPVWAIKQQCSNPSPAALRTSGVASTDPGPAMSQPSSAADMFVDLLLMPMLTAGTQPPLPALPERVASQNSVQQAADQHNNSMGSMRTQSPGAEVAVEQHRDTGNQQTTAVQPVADASVATSDPPLSQTQTPTHKDAQSAAGCAPAGSCYLQPPQYCYPFFAPPTYPQYFGGSYLPDASGTYPPQMGVLQYNPQQQHEQQAQQMLAQQAQQSMPMQAQPMQPLLPQQLQQAPPCPAGSYFPGHPYWRPSPCLPHFPLNPEGGGTGWAGMPFPAYAGGGVAFNGPYGPQSLFAPQQPRLARPPPAPPPLGSFRASGSECGQSVAASHLPQTSMPVQFQECYQYSQMQQQAATPRMGAGPLSALDAAAGTPLAAVAPRNVKWEPLILPAGTVKSEVPSDLSDVDVEVGVRQSSGVSTDLTQVVPDASLMAPIHRRVPLSVFSPPMLNQPLALHRQAAAARMVRQACLVRYREKKARRSYVKTIRYQMRKVNAEKRPRVKGRFVKACDPPLEVHEGGECPHDDNDHTPRSPASPPSPLVSGAGAPSLAPVPKGAEGSSSQRQQVPAGPLDHPEPVTKAPLGGV